MNLRPKSLSSHEPLRSEEQARSETLEARHDRRFRAWIRSSPDVRRIWAEQSEIVRLALRLAYSVGHGDGYRDGVKTTTGIDPADLMETK